MKLAHFAEQAMQRGLIDHLAGKNRFPVRLVDHHQSAQPGRPALIELLFETNPVDCHHSSFRVPLTARRRATRKLSQERSRQQGEKTVPKRSIYRVFFAVSHSSPAPTEDGAFALSR